MRALRLWSKVPALLSVTRHAVQHALDLDKGLRREWAALAPFVQDVPRDVPLEENEVDQTSAASRHARSRDATLRSLPWVKMPAARSCNLRNAATN